MTLKVARAVERPGQPAAAGDLRRFQQRTRTSRSTRRTCRSARPTPTPCGPSCRAVTAPTSSTSPAGSGGLQSLLPLAKAGYVADLVEATVGRRAPARDREQAALLAPGQADRAAVRRRPGGVMYHPDVLADLGFAVPTTMSQFLAACRTAKSKGKYFLNLAGASAQNAVALRDRGRDEQRAREGPGLEPRSASPARRRSRARPQWRDDAPADRRHEERRLLPARRRGERQHPGDPRASSPVRSWAGRCRLRSSG